MQHRIEIRPFFLPIDTSALNGNREMPSGYQWSICVLDSTLPAKGTAHRANRGCEKALSFKPAFIVCVEPSLSTMHSHLFYQ